MRSADVAAAEPRLAALAPGATRDQAARLGLWSAFCAAHQVDRDGVPLFAVDDAGRVVTAPFGSDGRPVLARAEAMEAMVLREVRRIVESPVTGPERLEGLLYLMFWRDGGRVVPLYIGRAGRFGRSPGRLSANLRDIGRDRGKFARWGSNHAYHIGGLSAVACVGHAAAAASTKYRRWASRLFVDAPSAAPLLRRLTFFWATAWGPRCQSIWREYGSTQLAFEEYLLIGVAADLFPGVLLNAEGVNRSATDAE